MATPLGNLGDVSPRARAVLAASDLVACEDTRVTRRLCAALGLRTPKLLRYDDRAGDRAADARVIERILAAARAGVAALVSDAGTPLIADPGYRLVRAARDAGVAVRAVPGPSAAMAALSIAGLPTDRVLLAGFLPARPGARRAALDELAALRATLVLFEAPHRLPESLAAMAEALGPREAAVARELTKAFEELRHGTLDALAAHYAAAGPPRGEVVVVVAPPARAAASEAADGAEIDRRLDEALRSLSLRDAARAVAGATRRPRREIYARALARAGDGRS